MKKFVRFMNDESGATAIEYGLIAAAMGLMLVAVMPTPGNRCFGRVRRALDRPGKHANIFPVFQGRKRRLCKYRPKLEPPGPSRWFFFMQPIDKVNSVFTPGM